MKTLEEIDEGKETENIEQRRYWNSVLNYVAMLRRKENERKEYETNYN